MWQTYISNFLAALGADCADDVDGVQVLDKVPLVHQVVGEVAEVLRGGDRLAQLLGPLVVDILNKHDHLYRLEVGDARGHPITYLAVLPVDLTVDL